ncbi:hypothetical protein ABW21_db0206569 [Orbilia brochopaga]|nr:hypothetical protein ABW21_db0206569 [Drechslerella brochopaga]
MLYLPLPRSTSSNVSARESTSLLGSLPPGLIFSPSDLDVVGVLMRSDRSSRSSFFFAASLSMTSGGGVSVLRVDCRLVREGVRMTGVPGLEEAVAELGMSSRALPMGRTALGAWMGDRDFDGIGSRVPSGRMIGDKPIMGELGEMVPGPGRGPTGPLPPVAT